jgi:hypothetical protein
MELQKELRLELKKLEKCESGGEFVDCCYAIPDKICSYTSDRSEKEFKEIMEGLFKTEPWHFIGQTTTIEYQWLKDIHKEIKKRL